MNKKNLGIAIRQLRVQLELSQEELADKSELHRTYIGSVERGERNIAIDNVIKLASALDCRVSDIILLAEDMEEF
ncbi:helix-turn-helix transcriptional regulator [Microbulbifer sp. OS29]|uniref:Helix-turn-helix transcriptional regulator n=1 Tax=Microbulbifer okhotskensis TaxID=2926617 RepID=A0A9X2J8L6_9GAMM|nr:helix-turn-helix transcriptional regulator [Microbulbifer okhotskensis]MCO1335686.1 helix-turn-helix transcriptional regulator [Microbulbifer okhotskensis]